MNTAKVTPLQHFHIEHIDDVLPHIEGRADFIVAHKDGYSVIDYVYALPDSFDHPARLECRGIKFDEDGRILARPLHKFMNVGQTPDTQPDKIDFSQPHTITEKLDGSMIHPAIVNGEVVFMTRMGRTDVAVKAERHLSEVRDFCQGLLLGGATPIFEWTAPENRIVVRYEESRLTLLAVRNNVDGEYWPRATLEATGIPLVPALSATPDDFLAYARAIQGAEGFVIRFDNGLWVKVKGDDYVLKHKAKDGITQEKNILALVLNGGLDDVLPLLDEADAASARQYAADVELGLGVTAAALERFVNAADDLPQKEFATEVVPQLKPEMRPLAFLIRRGMDAGEVIRARIAANINSQTQVDTNRALHGATWRY